MLKFFLAELLRDNNISHYMDQSDSNIGKKYWRVDEMGIPYCLTVDDQTLLDGSTVTLREINTRAQIRVKVITLFDSHLILPLYLNFYFIFFFSMRD